MLEISFVELPCGEERVERRLSAPEGDVFPGVIVCPEVEEPPDPDRDPGWPGLADHLAASVPAAVLLASGTPRYSPAAFVEEARAAVRALAKDERCDGRVALVGFGLGAAAALVVSSSEARVKGVAALGAAADPSEAGFGSADHLVRLREAGLAAPADPAAWRREFIAHSPVRQLSRVSRVPVLVVHGAADDVVPLRHGKALAAATCGELRVLPSAGHDLRRSRAAVEHVVEFLRRLFPR